MTKLENQKVDVLIKNAKVFNDTEIPVVQDVSIRDGRVFERGTNLNYENVEKVINAEGLWLMPGLFDIHTHYDLELEVAPGLPESVRHGTTSVVIANCSLGLAFGSQRDGTNDPIVSCYARVENIPKSVLKNCADNVDWENPKEYLDHLEKLNLGPNVVVLLPHSMLRIEVMGFDDSVTRDPTEKELQTMCEILDEAIDLGYVGLSTDALPFHYLAAHPHTEKTIPTQFAKYGELKKLTNVLRDKGAVWQATPPKDSVIGTLKTFLLTSARVHGKALKTTVVAALDIVNNWKLTLMVKTLARLLNSKFIDGDFHMQALGARFKIWSDGAITPIAEEIPELRRLNETDLEDRGARNNILRDPSYIKLFHDMWMRGKEGWSIDRLKRELNVEDYAFNRKLSDMTVDRCPEKSWEGRDFQSLFERVMNIKQDHEVDNLIKREQQLVQKDFFWIADEGDFMLQMLRSFDTDLSWSTVTANRDLKVVRELLMHPMLLPGFNDSGAHLTNMAFYDGNLRSLKLAHENNEDSDVAYMVKRLTKDAAEVFGVSGGSIYENDKADLILVDPNELKKYDGEKHVARVFREEFNHEQLVNRSDNVVPLVIIGGHVAWEDEKFSKDLGQEQFGELLKSKISSNLND